MIAPGLTAMRCRPRSGLSLTALVAAWASPGGQIAVPRGLGVLTVCVAAARTCRLAAGPSPWSMSAAREPIDAVLRGEASQAPSRGQCSSRVRWTGIAR